MKKIVYMIIVLLLILSLGGCNALNNNGSMPDNPGSTDIDQTIEVPNTPEIEVTESETGQPEIEEEELMGNTDTSWDIPVIILKKTTAEMTGDD